MASLDSSIAKFVGHSAAIGAVTMLVDVIALEHMDASPEVLLGIAIVGALGWIALLVRFARQVRKPGYVVLGVLVAMAATGVAVVATVVLTVLTGIMNVNFGHGRPLHGARRPGVRWTLRRCERSTLPWRTRMRLAAAWLHDARCEEESVAAFEQLARRLAAVGAPAALVADARRFAEQERGHARACLAQARRHAGVVIELADAIAPALGSRADELAVLATEALDDGCLGEGMSAAAARLAIPDASDPQSRALLETIAREEAEHAAHGWDVLAYCLATGGERVRARVGARLDALARRRPIALSPRTRATRVLAEHGRATERSPGATYDAVRRRVVARTRAQLAAT